MKTALIIIIACTINISANEEVCATDVEYNEFLSNIKTLRAYILFMFDHLSDIYMDTTDNEQFINLLKVDTSLQYVTKWLNRQEELMRTETAQLCFIKDIYNFMQS